MKSRQCFHDGRPDRKGVQTRAENWADIQAPHVQQYRGGELALVEEYVPKKTEDCFSGGGDIIINIFNFFLKAGHNEAKVFIVLGNF